MLIVSFWLVFLLPRQNYTQHTLLYNPAFAVCFGVELNHLIKSIIHIVREFYVFFFRLGSQPENVYYCSLCLPSPALSRPLSLSLSSCCGSRTSASILKETAAERYFGGVQNRTIEKEKHRRKYR